MRPCHASNKTRVAYLRVLKSRSLSDGYPTLTTIGTEYRSGMRNAFRSLLMSKPSIGHEASPHDVAASSSSCGERLS